MYVDSLLIVNFGFFLSCRAEVRAGEGLGAFGLSSAARSAAGGAAWAVGFAACARQIRPPAPRPAAQTMRNTTFASLSCFNSMVFSTPSVRAATRAETTPVAACPAAHSLAAWIVADTAGTGAPADSAPCDRAAANPPPVPAGACPPRPFPHLALPLVSHPESVPSGTPSCRAASLRVLPSRSHSTIAERYLP